MSQDNNYYRPALNYLSEKGLRLAEILGAKSLKPLIDDFYQLTGIGIGITDIEGDVVVSTGLQRICTMYHRRHPETLKRCLESDIQLSRGIPEGQYKFYKCKNNLWDIATPIMMGNVHLGNIFLGQIFFDDDYIDMELFRRQAEQYGFDREDYLKAVQEVPVYNRKTVLTAMGIYRQITKMLSERAINSINLSIALSEKSHVMEALELSAIENRELLKESNRRNNEITGMLDIAREVFKLKDKAALSQEIFKVCKNLIGNKAGFVSALKEDGSNNEILSVDTGGQTCNLPLGIPVPVRGIRSDAYNRRAVICENNLGSSANICKLPEGHISLDNILIVPLFVGDRPLGLLGLANKEGGFTDRDINTVTDLGGIVSLALLNIKTLDALRLSMQKAEDANRTKSEFLANMSHELRTPMNAVVGFTELLSSTNLTEEQREYVKGIKLSSETMIGLLSDILDIARLEKGKISLVEEPFELNSLLVSILEMFRFQAESKSILLTLTVQEGLPTMLLGDETRLKQVLVNIIGNAVKFTDSGSIDVSVNRFNDNGSQRIGEKDDIIRLVFAIKDSGIGIPADSKEIIFESFTQVDSSLTRRFQGAGLGLAICKKVIELMKGEIWVESEHGRGSTFFFTVQMKIHRGRSYDPMQQERHRQLVLQSEPDRKRQLLLVEDNPLNQTVVRQLLERRNYAVDIACNGLEGLERLRDKRYDLVLMDIQMPELNGDEAARLIRAGEAGETNKNLPIIALTAHAMQGDRERFLEIGMNDYVSKPINLSVLMEAINRCIS